MTAVNFKEANVVFAKGQPEYLPLPAFADFVTDERVVVTCYKMSFRERLRFLFTNRIWLSVLTFGNPLQPQRMEVDKREVFINGGAK